MTNQTETPLTFLRIERTKGLFSLRLAELWNYRELLYFLSMRDIKVRYKQTALGVAWAIIQPRRLDGGFQHLFRAVG